MKKFISLLLVIIMIFSLFGCTKAEIKSLEQYNNSNPKEMSLLTVKDGYIVNENGENVVLKGVNLGNLIKIKYVFDVCPGFLAQSS